MSQQVEKVEMIKVRRRTEERRVREAVDREQRIKRYRER